MERLAAAATAAVVLLLLVQGGVHEGEARRGGAAAGRRLPKTMVFYMHDIPTPPNATAVVVARQRGGSSSSLFGTTLVFDDRLTAGPDPRSSQIGRGQGFYSLASLPGSAEVGLLLVFSAVFHRPPLYNGSTLCLQGSDRISLPEREIAVVGGTGRLRLARGYAILSTISFQSTGNAIIKFNVTFFL